MMGVLVFCNGWYISILVVDFWVVEVCSGINFLIFIFMVVVFYVFMYMDKIGKCVVFIVMGLLVLIVVNGLWVYFIIMIVYWGNVEVVIGFDYLVYGWIFFVVIFIVLFVFGWCW